MDTTTDLATALSILQDSQKALTDAIEALSTHNNDLSAHPQIQEMINQITGQDAIYTNAQIRQLIKEGLEEHTKLDFKTAHGGWDAWETANNTTISKIQADITNIQNRLDGTDDTDQSELSTLLQAVEDKYAPIIEGLQQAFQNAQLQGETELANKYAETISSTLNQKRDELLAVMEEWQSTHGAGVSTPTILVGFDANGGTGTIDAMSVTKGEGFILPACTFTPPGIATFVRWSDAANGSGDLNGQPGNIIETTKEMGDSLTFYAIWSTTE